MTRLGSERSASLQKLAQLKKELSSKWEHINFDKLFPEQTVDLIVHKNGKYYI